MTQKIFKSITLLAILFAFTYCSTAPIPVTPETALNSYLNIEDSLFSWDVVKTEDLGEVTAYHLLLTSQKWREHIWTHQLTLLVPEQNLYDGALLFITGGSVTNGQPNWLNADNDLTMSFRNMAQKDNAIIAILHQVPNQPMYDGLVEDELISLTLHNFKQDGDYTWPLLFPMVKSAVRAMDAIQAFSEEQLQHEINRFVVSGGSKRGWTTWLTGAMDSRVSAIAPMVIDVLNMPVNLDYQMKVWKDYSVQIEDYVKLGIPQDVHSEKGDAITKMVDPYSYRKKLTLPKMIIIGTNDEYWPVDAIKHYLSDIPGENYIHYVPNAGHDLGDRVSALKALSAFFGRTMLKVAYPECTWDINTDNGQINLTVKTTPDELIQTVLWEANSTDRDFRDDTWSVKTIETEPQKVIETNVAFPDTGYRAFYLDLEYVDPNGGSYTKSTRMFVSDDDEVFIE